MTTCLRAIFLLILLATFATVQAADETAKPLPLLPDGLYIGAIHTPPTDNPDALSRAEARLGELIQAGMNAYELPISWSDIEPSPGLIDTTSLENSLEILSMLNLRVYLSITTINTVKLTLPADLMTADQYELADNRHFDDPIILARFNALLDAIVPLLVQHGGFFVSGNEVEGWLESRPDEVSGYVGFVSAARDHAHQLEPRLSVGVTLTGGGIKKQLPFLNDLLAVSDAATYTYYPLNDDFSVQDPAVVAADLAMFMEASGDLPVLFQEIGYPAGYVAAPNNGSSLDMQRQFYENFFAELQRYPQVRFVSALGLSDWSTTICDAFVQYYTNLQTFPQMHEFLCSLGMIEYDGTPKPAYAAFLAAVQANATGQAN